MAHPEIIDLGPLADRTIVAALLAANRPAVSHPAAARRPEANLSTVHPRICRREAIRSDQVRSDDRSWWYLGPGVCTCPCRLLIGAVCRGVSCRSIGPSWWLAARCSSPL